LERDTMAGPTLGRLAAAALAALDDAEPDPTLDEIADALDAGSRPRDQGRPQVLLIDPDRDTRPALARALTEAGCEVVAALRTGMAAEYAVRQHRPTVIVMDLDLRPGGARRGLLLAAALTEEAPTVPLLVVALPGHDDHEELAGRVLRAGARRLLSKHDVNGLVAAVRAEHEVP
jgi:DNA-binding NarL/FixJ family response regulator